MSMFQVGDPVSISPNATRCFFGCNEDMRGYIGCETVITGIFERNGEDEEPDVYKIECDHGEWSWSENCFIAIDENEITVSDDEFSGILSFLTASDRDTTPPAPPLCELLE